MRYNGLQFDSNSQRNWNSILFGDYAKAKAYRIRSKFFPAKSNSDYSRYSNVGIVYGGTHYMSAKKESVAAVKEETTKNELQVYKDKAKSLIANQNKNALQNPDILDSLEYTMKDKNVTVEQLKKGITAVENNRKPSNSGRSWQELVEEAKTKTKGLQNATDADSKNKWTIYQGILNSGDANTLEEFLGELK